MTVSSRRRAQLSDYENGLQDKFQAVGGRFQGKETDGLVLGCWCQLLKRHQTHVGGLDKSFDGVVTDQISFRLQSYLQPVGGFIAKSFKSADSDIEPTGKALFYSVNEKTENLNDAYLDMLISQLNEFIIRHYRRSIWLQDRPCEGLEGRLGIQGVMDFLFDADNTTKDNLTRAEANFRNAQIGKELPKMLCKGIVYYNSRTNSLHYKRNYSGDDWYNLVATRRFDTIKKYIEVLNGPHNSRLNASDNECVKFFLDSLLDVDFNADENGVESKVIQFPRNPTAILRAIENDIYEKAFKYGNTYEKQEAGNSSCARRQPYDVLVIDGLSELCDKDLEDFPFTSIVGQSRQLAKVSIFVFDEREGARCDADMVIDMNESMDENEEYVYHTLRISKSLFQTTVLGWHQYKRRDEGIEIFPSIHLLLSKRYYIAGKRQQIGQDLYESNYDEYIDSLNYEDCILEGINDCPAVTPYEDYLKQEQHHAKELHKLFFLKYREIIEGIPKESKQYSLDNPVEALQKVLSLYTKQELQKQVASNKLVSVHGSPSALSMNDHFTSTVLIGNPNSYKRMLALSMAYKMAQQQIHTVFFLFDKDELDMRRKMVCPAFCNAKLANSAIKESGLQQASEQKDNEMLDRCYRCSHYIHTYNLRMGCISAEEFFSILLDQISLFCNPAPKTGLEQSWFHIVIDDLQKIDFSFPFLRSNSLFLSTLLAVCQKHFVKLTILCDKSASLAHEACSLADNVIDLFRSPENINEVDLFVERDREEVVPSHLVKFHIKDILHLFTCDGLNMKIDNGLPEATDKSADNGHETVNEPRVQGYAIGSMKDFWRKKYYVEQVSRKYSNGKSVDER